MTTLSRGYSQVRKCIEINNYFHQGFIIVLMIQSDELKLYLFEGIVQKIFGFIGIPWSTYSTKIYLKHSLNN